MITREWYHSHQMRKGVVNKKQLQTLKCIFKNPLASNVRWDDIESLFIHLGAHISEGRGSRVRVELNGEDAVFHRPHPQREICKGALKAVRKFLEKSGINDDEI